MRHSRPPATPAPAPAAFEAISAASRDGTASLADVRAAFEAYARAQLAAARRVFQQYFPPGSPSLADELIAERRAAAADEDR